MCIRENLKFQWVLGGMCLWASATWTAEVAGGGLGACCDPFNGTCNDLVQVKACSSFDLFFEGMGCAELDPPCGIGACCGPEGGCTETFLFACPPESEFISGSLCESTICEPSGCGACQLYGDLVPVGCLVDIDDLLCALRDFADPLDCPGDGDIFPCGGNGIVDVDDLLAVLSAFAGIAACPPPCPPGACIADFPGPPAGSECRDGNTTGAYFFPGGMSESDCYSAGGIYCGDFGVCDVDCP